MVTANVITLPPIDRDAVIASVTEAMRSFHLGKPVNVKLTIARPDRTSPQNRYLWSVPYRLLGEQFGFEPEEIHEYLLGSHFGWVTRKLPGGRSQEVPMRTTTTDEDGNEDLLSAEDFDKYWKWIQRVGAKQGVLIPDPDKNYKAERVAA